MRIYNSEREYLQESNYIDFSDPLIQSRAKEVRAGCGDDVSIAKALFEYVRDEIDHSFDVQARQVTSTASEVLSEGHGICYAKSHLLAAMLRASGIPAGICYQKLVFEDGDDRMCLHSLNGLYLRSLDKWIRVDARGNKPGVDAQFDLHNERLAFPIRPELGEEDYLTVYASPIACITESLLTSTDTVELAANLPVDVGLT